MRLSHKLQREPEGVKQKMQVFFANPDFKDAVSKLRIKWGLKSPGIQNLQKIDRIVSKGKKINGRHFSQDIWELMEKFNRHSEWQSAIENHIAGMAFQAHHDPDAPILEIKMHEDADPINGMWIIKLRLFKSTTLNDMKRNWKKIKQWSGGGQKKRIKVSKNLERDRKIFQLYEQEKTTEEIYHIIKKDFKDELDFGNIKKIISSFKKKINK